MSTPDPDGPGPRPVELVRTVAGLVLLAAVVATQAPGKVVGDTKLDLTADPWGLMARSLHLWDAEAAFGQLQNQGYGYLFPMAPFHAVLGEVLPDWVVQRLWWWVLLVAGYLGMRRLTRALGVRGEVVGHLAGLAYALSPRAVSTIAPISSEAQPLLLAPWVVLPLVLAHQGVVTARRAAALSGVAVLLMGGVNATATAAACLPAAVWLLSRGRWWRSGVTWWWFLAGTLATSWWIVPLLTLGRYSPPFLDWIEDARAVSSNVEVLDVVRGASHWLGYVVTTGGPWWDAGFDLATSSPLVVATATVSALGLAGLAVRGVPERRFLLACLVLGLCAVALPHDGPAASPVAGPVRDLLDGPLAPLRNVHKFDPLVRLPLVLGLAHLLVRVPVRASLRVPAGAPRWLRARVGGAQPLRQVVVAVAAAAVAVAALPAVGGRLASPGGWESIPPWWGEAADWLAQHDGGRSLLVPASNFGEYTWGRTMDEPLQPLAGSPWAVRNGVPLAPAGSIRNLDAVEDRLRSGEALDGATEVLRRSGVRYLVLRADLDTRLTGGVPITVARASLRQTADVRRVAAFGPQVVLDAGVRTRVLEVYDLGPAASRAVAYPLASTTVVGGAPEALVPLADRGRLGGRATVALADLDPHPLTVGDLGGTVVTDTLRARQRSFGATRTADLGPVLTAEQVRSGRDRDYLPWQDADLRTVARYEGVRALTSSALAGPPSAPLADSPAHRPYAAFDTDPGTAWVAQVPRRGDAWLQVELEAVTEVRGTTVRLLTDEVAWRQGLRRPARLVATTDTGTATTEVATGATTVELLTPAGSTRTLRVDLVVPEGSGVTGVATLAVPGVGVREVLDVPDRALAADADPGATIYSLGSGHRADDGCLLEDGALRCSADHADLDEFTELVRTLPVAHDGTLALAGTLRPRPGSDLDRLLDVGGWARVTASSRRVASAAGRPGAVVDGDPRTAWSPGADDRRPSLDLVLPTPQRVERIQLLARDGWFQDSGATVRVAVDGTEQFVTPTGSGVVELTPVTGSRLRIEVLAGLAEDEDHPGVADLEITEVLVPGRQAVSAPDGELACGQGPPAAVDGELVPTRASWTADDLLLGHEIAWAACGPVPVAVGRAELVVGRLQGLVPSTAMLTPAGPAPLEDLAARSGPARTVDLGSWGPTSRTLELGAGDHAVLALTENTNPGWEAWADGVRLEPLVVDGWRQGWVVPAGDGGTVEIRFAPDGPYRAGLLVGLGLAVVLLGLVLVPSRRPARAGRATRPARPAARAAGAVLVPVLLAGLPGLAVGVLGAVVGRLGRLVPVAVGAAVLLAGLLRCVDPLPGRADWIDVATRLLVLAAVAAVLSRGAGSPPGATRTPGVVRAGGS